MAETKFWERQLAVVTPVFRPRGLELDPIRLNSVLYVLQFWFRAFVGGHLGIGASAEKMRSAQFKVFGSTDKAGRWLWSLDIDKREETPIPENAHWWRRFAGVPTQRQVAPTALTLTFTLSCRAPARLRDDEEKQWAVLVALLDWLVLVGSLQGRSRYGFGAIADATPSERPAPESLEAVLILQFQACRNAVSALMGQSLSGSTPGSVAHFPMAAPGVLSAGLLTPRPAPDNTMSSGGVAAPEEFSPAEGEPPWIAVTNRIAEIWEPRPGTWPYDSASFAKFAPAGLRLPLRRPDNAMILPHSPNIKDKINRRPSPFRFRPIPLSDGSWRLLVLFWNDEYLPSGSGLRIGKSPVSRTYNSTARQDYWRSLPLRHIGLFA